MVPLSQLDFDSRDKVRLSAWLDKTWKSTELSPGINALRHGKKHDWLQALDTLERITPSVLDFDDWITVGRRSDLPDPAKLQTTIEMLVPWRKGPFSLFGCEIDSEWQSQLKWNRVESHVELEGKRVLDVGCSNGYFGYRMLQAGATSVLGLEAFEPFVLQAALVNFFAQSTNVVIPHRFGTNQLPHRFDTVFSMGVSYHQRDLQSHLQSLHEALERSGEVFLESLVADSDLVPNERYANMRNVWLVPSISTLEIQLAEAGFKACQILDVSTTAPIEQRRTRYSQGMSLQDALDPDDPTKTVEGYPAPKRCVIRARK